MKPELPAVIDVGAISAVVGTGLSMVNVCTFEVPPPGAGLTTVIESVPAVVISAAVTVAVIDELEIKVVARGDPLKSAVDEAIKFVPLIVTVKSDPPAMVEVGLIAIVVGSGFDAVVTVNVWLLDVPPPGVGLATVTR